MFWTWDSYRGHAGWSRAAQKVRHQDPLARFITTVDRLFYVAAAVFAVSIISLLVG